MSSERSKLIVQALELGIKVFKNESDEKIQSNINAQLDMPGRRGFASLTQDQIKKADRIRKSLNVINRMDDCYGFGFSSESTACTERCPDNVPCVALIISREQAFAEDEALRSVAEKEWKASGSDESFAPKPMLAYVAEAQIKITPKSKIKWLLKKTAAKKALSGANVGPLDLVGDLVDLADDIKNFSQFAECCSVYGEERGAKFSPEALCKSLITANVLELT